MFVFFKGVVFVQNMLDFYFFLQSLYIRHHAALFLLLLNLGLTYG